MRDWTKSPRGSLGRDGAFVGQTIGDTLRSCPSSITSFKAPLQGSLRDSRSARREKRRWGDAEGAVLEWEPSGGLSKPDRGPFPVKGEFLQHGDVRRVVNTPVSALQK